jgi:glucose-6-phosphate isomerase
MTRWEELKAHHDQVRHLSLREIFSNDSERQPNYSLEVNDLYFDYSKNRVIDESIDLLIQLAESVELKQKIDDMFAGKKINTSEHRAVLHVALRAPRNKAFSVDGENVSDEVHRVLRKMEVFSKTIRSGEWKGGTGKSIKNVVNIGIGGSNLGPEMAVDALSFYAHPDLTLRFVSNIDEADFIESTKDLNPEETLFIIASKTFTTDETMTNAKTARKWIAEKVDDEKLGHHFVAVSNNLKAAKEFGVDEANVFEMWDWVGGRYSMTSAIGLPIITAIGLKNFREMLGGFHEIDEHFRTAPLRQNMPVIMGLLSTWYVNFYGAQSEAILPYSAYLGKFTKYLQQANMESNGKSIDKEGNHVQRHSGPVVWGEPGTDSQHSFMQLIHQGTWLIPVDFIGFKQSLGSSDEHHQKLMANMLAQSEALAFGLTPEELKDQGVDEKLIPHKTMFGNRPNNTLLLPKLDPYNLGRLIALYEHKIFVQGALWGINSFDQYGVELGKVLAKQTYKELTDLKIEPDHDQSTNMLIEKLREKQ